jgi:hypothetical protein
MSLSLPGAGASLAETAAAVAHWRSAVPRGSRIPEELWSRAVELAGTQGVGPVARALRLDYTALKRRVTRGAGVVVPAVAAPPPAAFVEYQLGLPAAGPDCVLALSDAHGRALRIEWRRAGAAEVATVARCLWEAGP